MNATPRRGALALLPAASMCLAATAQAQTPACDSLKSTLAARIEATGVRGYSLEAVPGRTAVPPDAKVIGTCEGGAYKMLYRRWGASRPVATAPASMPETKPEPKPLPAPPPVKAASAIPVATPPRSRGWPSRWSVAPARPRPCAPRSPWPRHRRRPCSTSPPSLPSRRRRRPGAHPSSSPSTGDGSPRWPCCRSRPGSGPGAPTAMPMTKRACRAGRS